jgi:hypothetical protein
MIYFLLAKSPFPIGEVTIPFYDDTLIVQLAELLAIRQRAIQNKHTVQDQMRIQWLSQAAFGTLDIYQHGLSTQPLNQGDILEEIDDWLTAQLDTFAVALLAYLLRDDNR